jgi:thioredoxin 1
MKPIIEELNEQFRGEAIIKYVDTYKYPEIKDGFPISGIPTQVFYDSEGNPYQPENPNHPWMNSYNDPETGQPEFTTHLGLISKEELLDILYAMGMEQ